MTSPAETASEWVNPGVFEVAHGVYRIPLPMPNDGLKAVNVYALLGEGGPVLIDSGWGLPQVREVLTTALADIGHDLREVRRFLVTHVHRDHYAQAVTIRRELGTPISLGIDERPSLERMIGSTGPPLQWTLANLRLMGAGELAARLAARLGTHNDLDEIYEMPDDWLEPGWLEPVTGRRLEVVPTPGHTRGHVVFHDTDARLLFAGDHVLPQITPSIGFEATVSQNPLGDFMTSLALVRGRPDAMLLPAHGPVTTSVHQRVDELIEHHGGRLDETERAIAGGEETVYQVAGRLRWTRRGRDLNDLDDFNQMMAVSETGAHVALLAAQGRLSMLEASHPLLQILS